MHHIYTTPAFVIQSQPHGESGKFLLLFTRDFGMIGATAQGIRLLKSKLRYHLQDFDFSKVSIVKGKEVWRITGASKSKYSKNNFLKVRILKLLKRFLHGEEKNEELFEIVELLYNTEIKEEDFELAECIFVLRILNNLGYVKAPKDLMIFLDKNEINEEILSKAKDYKSLLIKTINQSLIESQL